MVQVPLFYAHTRLAMLTLAVSASLFAVASNAAIIGTTRIDSAQHEPISATIEVRDIDADSFSASVAPNSMYQQMNMNANVAIDVRFVKTSNTTGKIILTSVRPVSDPFADVVLTVNDKGRQQTVPKTLLLPLGRSVRTSATPTKVIGTTPRPTLPMVSNSDTSAVKVLPSMITRGKPLQVKRKAPPPLVPSQPKVSIATTEAPAQAARQPQPTFNIAAKPQVATASPTLIIQPIPNTVKPIIIQPNTSSQSSGPMLTKLPNDSQVALKPAASSTQAPITGLSTFAQLQALNQAATSTSPSQAKPSSSAPVINNSATTDSPAPSAMNTQLDILTTTITRRYSIIPPTFVKEDLLSIAKAKDPAVPPVKSEQPLGTEGPIDKNVDSNIDRNLDGQTDSNINTASIPLSTDDNAAADTLQATTLDTEEPVAIANSTATTKPIQAKTAQSTVDTNPAIPLGEVTYTVQKNDNLWTIAQQISDKNNMSINQVMDEIQAYNPDAFISGEKSKLLADVELALPAYEVIPSRLGIQAAREARQETRQANKQTQARTPTNTNRAKPTVNKPAATKPTVNKPKQTAAKNVPRVKPAAVRPSLTLVTPSKDGHVAGTAPTAGNGGKGLNAELVATLKSSRQKTAAQAQRVGALNQQLSDRTRTLQLQNQRLANLERRLKKLRSK